jgi:hypothetical protein
MLSLNLLCLPFAHLMEFYWQIPFVGSPTIGAKFSDTKREEQLLELKKYLIFAPPKHICQDLPGTSVNRVP